VILFVLQFTAEVVYNVCKMAVCVVQELVVKHFIVGNNTVICITLFCIVFSSNLTLTE